MSNRLFGALLWLDIKIFWLVTLGHYRKGETISATAWSMYLQGRWQGKLAVPVIDWLFRPWQTHHCRNAYEWQAEIYQSA